MSKQPSLKHPSRIVVKFGSGILANANGTALDERQFARLAAEIAGLVQAGHECVIVSSGAVAAGLAELGLDERPDDLPSKQACAAIGQSKLMHLYATMFARHGLVVAQLLLTYRDLDSRVGHTNAHNTLRRLFEQKHVVPIINENDSVAVDEFGKFGDNDRLSAEVAVLVKADMLILLTSVDGLLDEAGKTVRIVKDIAAVARFARQEKGKFSVGGMVSKLQAVKLAVDAGISTHIASGRKAGRIPGIVSGKPLGTRFVAKGEASTNGSK